YEQILADTRDRSIILCHDIHAETAEAMERVLPELLARGYQFVTVSELLEYSDAAAEAGIVYYHG
ncbi:MAG: hypothetical protein LBT36_04670, partial [Oscillospiraceae bacterium]|nr:hypothetical protein [Oscillospiraceae bacterium]